MDLSKAIPSGYPLFSSASISWSFSFPSVLPPFMKVMGIDVIKVAPAGTSRLTRTSSRLLFCLALLASSSIGKLLVTPDTPRSWRWFPPNT